MKGMMKQRKANKGFSMLELIIAIGIMGVIVLVVGIMMTTSSSTYNRLSADAQLQSEAQIVANSISNLAIDAYKANNDLSDAAYSGLSFDKGAKTDAQKSLILESKNETTETRYIIGLNDTEKTLYYYQQSKAVTDADWGTISAGQLLAEHVSDFTVDTSRVDADNVLSFELSYVKGGKTYVGNYQVYMRNKEYTDAASPGGAPGSYDLKLMTLSPEKVYVDVKAFEPVGYHLSSPDNTLVAFNGGSGKIKFKVNSIFNGTATEEDKKANWTLQGADPDLFTLAPAKAVESEVTVQNGATHTFRDLTSTSFLVVASNCFKPSYKKTAQVRIRIVKNLTVTPATPVSEWSSMYEGITYNNGKKAPEAEGYAEMGTTVGLRANLEQYNVSDGVTWQLEYREADDTKPWQPCISADYATLAHNNNQTINTLQLGKLATNNYEFRITTTSVFDPSISDSYVLGVLPKKKVNNEGGFFSRGYYMCIDNLIQDLYPDNIKIRDHSEESYDPNNGLIEVKITSKGSTYEGATFRIVEKDGSHFLYLDFGGTMYASADERLRFYTEIGDVQMTITQKQGDKTYEVVNDGSLFRYYVMPVLVQKGSPDDDVIVLAKGGSTEIEAKTQYYNIVDADHFGIYIADDITKEAGLDNNLNVNGKQDTNTYLSLQIISEYGDPYHYVDSMVTKVTAKSKSKSYDPNPMILRFTSDDYYTLSGHKGLTSLGVKDLSKVGLGNIEVFTSSYVDYKILLANVEGQNVYLPVPATTKLLTESPYVWPSDNFSNKNSLDDAVTVTGKKTDGTETTGKVYYDNVAKKYKLNYNSTTYTYNSTFCYWQK